MTIATYKSLNKKVSLLHSLYGAKTSSFGHKEFFATRNHGAIGPAEYYLEFTGVTNARSLTNDGYVIYWFETTRQMHSLLNDKIKLMGR